MYQEWAVTNIRKKSNLLKLNKMLAVDCEMVLCEDGTEAVVKVCVVDSKLQVQINLFFYLLVCIGLALQYLINCLRLG